MTDPITRLFRRQLRSFWRRPVLDVHLVLRAARRRSEWLPQGWYCEREGEGWDRSWEIHMLCPRTLAFYKNQRLVFEINDTRHSGYRKHPVSGPLLDLMANGQEPDGLIEEISDFLHEAQKVGRAVKARHDTQMEIAHERRALKRQQQHERSLSDLKAALEER